MGYGHGQLALLGEFGARSGKAYWRMDDTPGLGWQCPDLPRFFPGKGGCFILEQQAMAFVGLAVAQAIPFYGIRIGCEMIALWGCDLANKEPEGIG